MRTLSGLALAAVLATAGSIILQAEDKPKQAKPDAGARVEQLIRQLGDNSYDARRKATNELIKLGKPAVAALEQASRTSKDPEVRWRAESIVAKIRAAEGLKQPRGQRPGSQEFPFPDPRGQMPEEMQKLFRRFRLEMLGPGGPGQNFSWNMGNGERRLSVHENGQRYDFKRAKDGSFSVTTHEKGKQAQTHQFKTEAEFKQKQPKLHAIWQRGAGIQIHTRIAPFGGANDALRKLMEQQFKNLFGERFKGFEEFKQMREQLERARKMLRQLEGLEQPGPQRALLRHGVESETASAALLAQFELKAGVVVTRVAGGLAAKLGLRKHDMVLSVGGKPIATPKELDQALSAGGEIEVVVLRRGTRHTLKAGK